MRKLNKYIEHYIKSLARIVAFGFVAFSILFIVYHMVFADRIIPGVSVGGINVGGKTPDEAREVFTQKLKEGNVLVSLRYGDKEFTVKGSDLSLVYDVDKTVDRAVNIGRTGNFITDSKDKLAGLVKTLLVPPFYNINEDALGQKVNEMSGVINVQVQDPTFILASNGGLVTTRAVEGRELNRYQTQQLVISAVDRSNHISAELPVKTISPNYTEAQLMALKSSVEAFIGDPPVVKYKTDVWRFGREETLGYLTYRKDGSELDVVADKVKVARLAKQLAAEVNVEPRGEVFKTQGERVIEFRPKENGKTLDEELFRKDFSEALTGTSKDVVLSVKETSAPGGTNSYGIYALLGEGISYYSGSIPNRIHNLLLASQRVNGILVAPGDTFSYNKSVGEISAATGYKPAYVIENGRTILGDGGGTCQSSTTVFRAALAAGLPIVKRTAHAYRVHYYEEKTDIGKDATVAAPSVDLQFKNDTPGYILLQADWDLSAEMLRFKIYGTPDGRVVDISKSVITSQTPPPPALYQDDPTLPKGTIKQVDFEAWGATTYFTRVVKRNGQEILNDTFTSNYRPWQAVYLKGTKD